MSAQVSLILAITITADEVEVFDQRVSCIRYKGPSTPEGLIVAGQALAKAVRSAADDAKLGHLVPAAFSIGGI